MREVWKKKSEAKARKGGEGQGQLRPRLRRTKCSERGTISTAPSARRQRECGAETDLSNRLLSEEHELELLELRREARKEEEGEFGVWKSALGLGLR